MKNTLQSLKPWQEAAIGFVAGLFIGAILVGLGVISPPGVIGVSVGAAVGGYVNALRRSRPKS